MTYGVVVPIKEIAGGIATINPNRATAHKQSEDQTGANSLSRLYKLLLELKTTTLTKFAHVYASWTIGNFFIIAPV